MIKARLLFSVLLCATAAPAFAGQQHPIDGDDMSGTISAEKINSDDQMAGLTLVGECGDSCFIATGDSVSDQAATFQNASYTAHERSGCHQDGIASEYNSGTQTASGERPHWGAMEAAHKSLPFGTRVRVHNKRTGVSVIVRINDRGPYVSGRIIDLTPAAARAIGMGDGLAPVTIDCVM